MDDCEELAELIAEGRNREAYDVLRRMRPQLLSYAACQDLVSARRVPHAKPFPTEAEIDARHDRIIASVEENKVKRAFDTLTSLHPAAGGKPDRASGLVARPAGAPASRASDAAREAKQ